MLAAIDAERSASKFVLTTVAYLYFILTEIAVWPTVHQLSPGCLPDQIEIQRARFFGNGSRLLSSLAQSTKLR